MLNWCTNNQDWGRRLLSGTFDLRPGRQEPGVGQVLPGDRGSQTKENCLAKNVILRKMWDSQKTKRKKKEQKAIL